MPLTQLSILRSGGEVRRHELLALLIQVFIVFSWQVLIDFEVFVEPLVLLKEIHQYGHAVVPAHQATCIYL
jgi:hypothetical protein